MKKVLLAIFGCLCLTSSYVVKSQTPTFTVPFDTVRATVTTTASIHDDITNTTQTSGLTLKWHVQATDFPSDWMSGSAFGICDNNTCRSNMNDTLLWNIATSSPGSSFNSSPYPYNIVGSFNLALDFSNASNGSHWVTVAISDQAHAYTKYVTFVINRVTSSVANVTGGETNVVLYPNPATNEINLVYDATAEVKNIAVYNIIGRLMTVYKVSGNSANLNLENTPSGIYFARLLNASGQVVATRKFTKQ